MVLFICILKDYRRVEDVLLGFLELGITGATILEGRGMGQLIGTDYPLFASIRGLFPGSAQDSHIVFSVTEAARAKRAMALLERTAGPLNRPGSGIAFTLPVGVSVGLATEID